MLRADRISERMTAMKLSQSALARTLGVSQQAVGKLISGDTRNTAKLVQLARALETTPDYLEGIVDDPAEGYTPPPAPMLQVVTMQVVLPSEAALARMFEGLLPLAEGDLTTAERARILAQRLPTGLAQLQELMPERATAEAPAADTAPPARATDRPASRRAPRT
ncbi:helix-turn-helix domain-containing protein [Sphingomonas sp. LT1P40]|uniref:helix-turn-helix domain-containing protein n=1 Tax=Alteristakelama amylovorans TaxID=3096166 RepID=UPI002FC78295